MTKSTALFYAVVYDDGDHSVELEQFSTHTEAVAYMRNEIDEWTNGTGWDVQKEANGEDYSIQIEVIQQDREDDEVYDPLECWDSDDGWMECST